MVIAGEYFHVFFSNTNTDELQFLQIKWIERYETPYFNIHHFGDANGVAYVHKNEKYTPFSSFKNYILNKLNRTNCRGCCYIKSGGP
eukprot:UN19863